MFALGIYNAVSTTDITRGHKIAGTGTISTDGKVGAVSGVKYKVLAAERPVPSSFCPGGRLRRGAAGRPPGARRRCPASQRPCAPSANSAPGLESRALSVSPLGLEARPAPIPQPLTLLCCPWPWPPGTESEAGPRNASPRMEALSGRLAELLAGAPDDPILLVGPCSLAWLPMCAFVLGCLALMATVQSWVIRRRRPAPGSSFRLWGGAPW